MHISCKLASVFFGFVVLSGCATELKVNPLTDANYRTPEARTGFAYSLPFTQFEIKLTRMVASCDGANFKGAVKAEITPGLAADGAQSYTIDYGSLSSLTKISDVQVTYHENGVLKSINASAEDRTGQIIVNTVTGLGKLIPAVAGLGGSGAVACKQPTLDALVVVKRTKEEIRGLTPKVEAATAAAARLTGKVTAMGTNVDPATKKALGDAIDTLDGLNQQLTASKNELASALEKISSTTTIRWPRDSATFSSSEPIRLSVDVLEKWASVSDMENKAKEFDVYLVIEPSGTSGRKFGPDGKIEADSDRDADARLGIRYRSPAPGRLLVCSPKKCASTDHDLIIAEKEGPIAQLGHVFFLPFRNESFGNSVLSATFSNTGVLQTAGFTRKAAPLEGASAAFKDSAEQVVSFTKAWEDAKTTELERLTEQTAVAKARKDLAAAEASLVEQPVDERAQAVAGLQADAAVKQAELTNVEAEIALRQARARLAGLP